MLMQVPIVVPKVVECTQHGVDTVSTRQQCFVAKGLKDKETPETDTQEADAEAVEIFVVPCDKPCRSIQLDVKFFGS